MGRSHPDDHVTAEADATALCLACGFCCQGVLHNHVELNDGEVALAADLSLEVLADKHGRPVFPQPCVCFQDGQCSVYARRPSSCRVYACELLKRCQAGEVSFEEGHRRVDEVKALLAAIYAHIGPREPGRRVWDQISDFANRPEHDVRSPDFVRDNARFLLDVKKLYLICSRHFEPRMAEHVTLPGQEAAAQQAPSVGR